MINQSPRYSLAKKKANEIIRDIGITTPPILLKDILEYLKILYNLDFYTRALCLSDKYSGEYIRQYNQVGIIWNKNHSEHRQRFTVGHELGHFVLDHEIKVVTGNQEIAKDKFKEKHPFEIEANIFSAHLLLPQSLLKKEVINNKQDLQTIADRFNVTLETVQWRVWSNETLTGGHFDYIMHNQKRQEVENEIF